MFAMLFSKRSRSSLLSSITRKRILLEHLESRWNPSAVATSMAGGIVQGNLYGDQSVVMALPIAGASGSSTTIQIIDTGDTGMAGQTINSFVPFAGYQGKVSMAVGDFLNKGYQQLIVSAAGNVQSHVKIFDLYQTFINNSNPVSPTPGTFTNPVTLQSFIAFDKAFKGGASVAAGDFNADGMDDLAVGAGPGGAPHVRVFNQGLSTTQMASFYAFSDRKFTGGVTLAAGHLNEDNIADLIVGAGKGGGSRVVSYSGSSIVSNPNSPTTQSSYFAFGSGGVHSAVQVQLIESIVAPETGPVTGLVAGNLTGLFTPTNNTPLVNGTIASYDPSSNTGLIGLYSLVSGSPVQSNVTIPTTTINSSRLTTVYMAPVGYMFNNLISNYAAPMALIANPVNSTISLCPLAPPTTTTNPAPMVQAVPNIYAPPVADGGTPVYNSNTFPFGKGITTAELSAGVKTIASNMTNSVAPGTSGTLPARQVAYQSPFELGFTNSMDSLFSDFSTLPWTNPIEQTTTAYPDGWYPSDSQNLTWGPDMQGPNNPNTSFPLPSLINNQPLQALPANFVQERMVAGALQIMNQGYFYQHHHVPAWFQPQNKQSVSQIIANYEAYSLSPAGMQTPGLDCSDYTNFITDFGLGLRIPTGVNTQGTTDSRGNTSWPNSETYLTPSDPTISGSGSLQGTSNIYINNIVNPQNLLNSSNLAAYYTQYGAEATYQMLNSTLQTGDFLYYGGQDATTNAVHVTMWVGAVGASNPLPLIMDSHGSGVQVGVDENGLPSGVVAPSGPQIRPWFVPPSQANGSGGFEPTAQASTYLLEGNPNYYYYQNFSHVIRPSLTVNATT